MKRRSNIALLLALASTLLLLLLWWRQSERKQVDWKTHLDKDSRAPYGAQVVFSLLDQYFGAPMRLVEDSLRQALPLGRRDLNYIFLGDGLLLDTPAVNHLLQFVHSGNAALLVAREFPRALLEQLYQAACNEPIWTEMETFVDTTVFVQSIREEPALPRAVPIRYIRDRLPRYRRWSYLPDVFYCEPLQEPIPLGDQPGEFTNFARFSYGVGVIYLHTTPLAFSNLNMLEQQQLNYAGWVVSHLPAGRTTYWDDFHQMDGEIVRNMEQAAQEAPSHQQAFDKDGPLRYILSQPPLAWAWYLALCMILLFIAFRAKRYQRIIPILPGNENTSLEFIQAIGRLALLQKDHRKIALMHWRSFLQHIRMHYQLSLRDGEAIFCRKLAQQAEVPEKVIQEILSQQKGIKSAASIEAAQLLTFYRALDQFYEYRKKAL